MSNALATISDRFQRQPAAADGHHHTRRRCQASSGRELLSGQPVEWSGGTTTLTLESEDVAVLEIVSGDTNARNVEPRGGSR